MTKRARYIPVRRFVVSVLFADGREITDTATGPNPDDAVKAYQRAHPTAIRVVLRSEIY